MACQHENLDRAELSDDALILIENGEVVLDVHCADCDQWITKSYKEV